MRHKPFLWPDHVIGKAESRRIREEHNAAINALADALDACRWVIENWESGDLAEAARACQDVIDEHDESEANQD